MNREQLEEIRARAEAASKGPWSAPEFDVDEGTWFILNGQIGTEEHAVACIEPAWSRRFAEANAAFIAHARADVPALLDEIDRLHVVVRRVISITQDTDGNTLGIDDEIPVGEVLRMLYEFEHLAASVDDAEAARPAGGSVTASDKRIVSAATSGGIGSREIQPRYEGSAEGGTSKDSSDPDDYRGFGGAL